MYISSSAQFMSIYYPLTPITPQSSSSGSSPLPIPWITQPLPNPTIPPSTTTPSTTTPSTTTQSNNFTADAIIVGIVAVLGIIGYALIR